MQQSLKNSLNLSNEFRLKELNDPINYEVSLRESVPELSEVPLRFVYKERKIRERDSLGGYRFYSDNLKKRKNPTEEYRKQLEEELIKKKQMLSEYESNGGHLSQEQIDSLKNKSSFLPNNTLNQNFYSMSYFNDVNNIKEKDIEYYQNLSANDNLLKVLDSQVDLLKQKGNEQFKKLSQSDEYNHLSKTKKYGRLLKDRENGLEEPGVYTQFLSANNNKIQTLKHVVTQDKPEYMPLDELQKMKEEHEKELLDIEDEYYGRKKMSEEELRRQREEKKRLQRLKQLNNMIQRPGYNNDKPLEEKDYEFINKYNDYLINKQGNADKIGYEEEWNTTKVKSLNANGIVDRNDGLPGYLDQDDYKLYYYDINEEGGELNFERPLKTHKHSGRENTLKRTFRNEPGYEKTKGKFFRTGSMPDMTNNINEDELFNETNKLKIINDRNNIKQEDKVIKNNNNNIDKNEEKELEKKIKEKNEQFIKLIFGMLTKNQNGQVPKCKIISEMKLDENSIKDLGFKNREDFENKLNNYPSKDKDFMTEKEFNFFILHKKPKSKPKKINQNVNNENINIFQNNNQEQVLPGMSTSYFDFLKNPSTTARLEHINKTLDEKNMNYRKIKNTKNKNVNYNRNQVNIHNKKINKSYDGEKNNTDENIKFNSAINAHFNKNNYSKKSDLNFTIPKPFEFLKEDYHGKKLIKMREILEERKKNEEDIFRHTFHANSLNRKMFDTNGDLNNIIEREKIARQKRVDKKKQEIISHSKPFSFYEADLKSFLERKSQECIPPKFIPFKANPIQYKSQVNMYMGNTNLENERRKERIHQRALSVFNAASLPPRMEMHEKQKKLQEKEKKLIEQRRQQTEKDSHRFKYKKAPNFKELQEKFISILEKKKGASRPTQPKPFTFHEPKKKVELCQYLDYENDPKIKNPKKENRIENVRKKMQKKPDIEPPSTKSLKLLMDKRRKDLEERKKREESVKREDEARIRKQHRLNQRVRSSSVIRGNQKELEIRRKRKTENFLADLEQNKQAYESKLKVINQNVENRPLMMEAQVKKKDVFDMKQN